MARRPGPGHSRTSRARTATASSSSPPCSLQGTVKALDLPAGYSSPSGLTALGAGLYFTTVNSQSGTDFWISDGTLEGTVRLTDSGPVRPPNSPFVPGFTQVGSLVLFTGLDPQYTLWRTDGTAVGTLPVAPPPAGPVEPYALTLMNGVLYMLDDSNHLWRTDGTAAGTTQVSPQCCMIAPLVVSGGKLFFEIGAEGGPRLWSSDGTAAGTAQVQGPAAGRALNFGPLAAVGGRVFFAADDGGHGVELWQSDGTAQGTRLVDDIAPGFPSSYPAGMTQAGNQLYFSANDGLSGNELWALPLAGGPAWQGA